MSVFGKAGRRVRGRDRNRTIRPIVELCEERTLLSTFTVTKTIDDGSMGTLRWAIGQANTGDTIVFNIGAVGSQQIIHETSSLSTSPLTSKQVTIDGLSQGGSGYTGPPLVTIDGTNAGASADGLTLQGNNDTITGMEIVNFAGGDGILIQSSGDTITDNLIGTSGNPNKVGVLVNGANNGTGATIGGPLGVTPPAGANTIGFNTSAGVSISGSRRRRTTWSAGTSISGPTAPPPAQPLPADDIRITGSANNGQTAPTLVSASYDATANQLLLQATESSSAHGTAIEDHGDLPGSVGASGRSWARRRSHSVAPRYRSC